MLNWIRVKFGTVLIAGIIGFIAFVFVVGGVFSPKSTRGLHEGAVAGTVNGESISITDFNRELHQRMEYLKKLGGDKVTEEQLKSLRLRQYAFQNLVTRKVMIQEAERQGLVPADDEVRDSIKEMPGFQKDGHFDLMTYKGVLDSNQYTPASFEKLVRQDLMQHKWMDYFKSRVVVSKEELRREFQLENDKRQIKYVIINAEAVQKDVSVQDSELDHYLADAAHLKTVQAKFDAEKETSYKGQKFEDVKRSIVRSILSHQKLEEGQKRMTSLADQVVAHLGLSKAADKQVEALIKSYGLKLKTTSLESLQTLAVSELVTSSEFVKDAFASQSAIDLQQGGKPKAYPLAARVVVAAVMGSEKANMTHLTEQKQDELREQLAMFKIQEIYQGWMRGLMTKATIDVNQAVLAEKE